MCYATRPPATRFKAALKRVNGDSQRDPIAMNRVGLRIGLTGFVT